MGVPEPPAWLELALAIVCGIAATVELVLCLLGLGGDRATGLALIACGLSFANSYELRERL